MALQFIPDPTSPWLVIKETFFYSPTKICYLPANLYHIQMYNVAPIIYIDTNSYYIMLTPICINLFVHNY